MWDFRVLAEECITELEWLAFVCVGRGSFSLPRGLIGWLQFLHACRQKVKEPGPACSLQRGCVVLTCRTEIYVTITQMYSIWTEHGTKITFSEMHIDVGESRDIRYISDSDTSIISAPIYTCSCYLLCCRGCSFSVCIIDFSTVNPCSCVPNKLGFHWILENSVKKIYALFLRA